ncbi:MAG: hypothetical protein HKN73_12910 [Gemmatimonadetes bacterium]|nr:hypothetical protein [Gemmatimonadota bacterium]
MLSVLLALAFAAPPAQEAQTTVYRTLLLRAAPGHLQDVLDALEQRLPVYDQAGVESPFVMRHSQGDHWDLMLIFPVRSAEDWFGERAQRWRGAAPEVESDAEFERRIEPWLAWREDTFVEGPALGELRRRDGGAGFYHIEMFVALPGKRAELLHQRRIENDYLEAIGRDANFIFTRVAGGPWDVYTLGLYRDLQHYAEPNTLSAEALEAAAVTAGFASRGAIGTYLRELIASHHDTLATRVH